MTLTPKDERTARHVDREPFGHDQSLATSHRELTFEKRFFSGGVYERGSGVFFATEGDQVSAQLGWMKIALTTLTPTAIVELRKHCGSPATCPLPPEVVKAFYEEIIPKLIKPVEIALRRQIDEFKANRAAYNSRWPSDPTVESAVISSEDPLVVSIQGHAYPGKLPYITTTGTLTWTATGSLLVEVGQGKSARIPVSSMLTSRDDQSLLHNFCQMLWGPSFQ